MNNIAVIGVLVIIGLLVFAITTMAVGPLFIIGILVLAGVLGVVYGASQNKISKDLAVKLVIALTFIAVIFLAWDVVKDIFSNTWILLITAVTVIIGMIVYFNKKMKFTKNNRRLLENLVIIAVFALIAWLLIDFLSPGSLPVSSGINRYGATFNVGISANNVWPFWSSQPKISGMTDPVITKSGICASSFAVLPEQIGLHVIAIDSKGNVVFNKVYNSELEHFAIGSTSASIPIEIPCLLPDNYSIRLEVYDSGERLTSSTTNSISISQ